MGDKLLFSQPVEETEQPKAASKSGLMFSAPLNDKGDIVSPDERLALDNAPDETALSGGVKNIATGLIKGVGGLPGMFGDVNDFAKYLAQRAHSWASGKPMPQIQKETDQYYDAYNRALPYVLPGIGLALATNSQKARDLTGTTKLLKEHTGEYTPTTGAGRVVANVAEAVPSMAIPMGPVRSAAGAAKEVMRQAPANLAGTTAGAVAAEATGEPLLAVPAGVGASTATHAATTAAHQATPTVRQTSKQATADREFRDMFVDPRQAANRLNNPPETLPNERLTTGMVTLDPGALITEHRAANMDDGFRARMSSIATDQNNARVNTLRQLQTGGDPQAVSRLFMQHLDDLDTGYDAAIVAAREQAERAAAAIPGGGTPEGLGETLRNIVTPLRDQARARRSALYRAVDPDNSLIIATGDLPAVSEMLLRSHPTTGVKLTHALTELQKGMGVGRAMPFSDLRGLDSAVSDAMAKATRDGSHTDLNLLTSLKSEIKRTMANAMENQIAFEQAQVARGALAPDATSTARFEQWLRQGVEDYRANTAAVAGTGTAGVPGVGATARPGVSRAASEAGPAPGSVAGDQGLPTPNVTDEHVARLAEAHRAHADFANQYRAGPTGALLKETGFGQHKTLDSGVPDLVFKPGNTGYETAQHILAGAENRPQAIATMQDIATMKLRQMMGEASTLSPQILSKWKTNYAQALRALDEVSPGYSARFDDAVAATTALATAETARVQGLREARRSLATRLAGIEGEETLVNYVGELIKSKAGADQTRRLRDAVSSNPEAVAGVREAAARWLLNELGNGTVRDGERVLSNPRAISLLAERPETLRNIFGDEGMDLLRQYEASVLRQQEANTAVATAGSNTGANITKMMQKQLEMRRQAETLGQTGAFALWEGLGSVARGDIMKAGALLGGRWMMNKLDGLRQRGIADVQEMVLRGLENPEVGRAMLNRALTAGDTPAGRTAWSNLMEALTRQSAYTGREAEERRQRARGGQVGLDHAAEADRILRAARAALRQHAKNTEPLMNVPDEHVTKALALANEAI